MNSETDESDIDSLFSNQSDVIYIKEIIEKLKSIEILNLENNNFSSCLKNVQWAITDRCNLNCIHCCQDAEFIQTDNLKNRDLSVEALYNIADLLCHVESLETISITGGEPLLCNQCKDISAYIRKIFKGKTILMTNSLMINTSNIWWIVDNFDHISISLDGSCAELTKLVRQKDIFDRVLSKVKLLQDYNFTDISVSAILPDARETMEEFDKLCKDLNVDPIIRSYSMSGRGASGHDQLMKAFNEFIDRNGYERLPMIDDLVISGLNRCNAGISQLTIESNGNIQPCAILWNQEFTLGNIKDMNVNTFSNLTRKNTIFNFDGVKCSQCSYKGLCWHCYDEFIFFKQHKDQFDKRCVSKKISIENILWGK